MATLENDYLKVSIRTKGAELTSIFDKRNNIEHLWQADPKVWNWHAPNLFPVIGESYNHEIHVGGEAYAIERHGFARQSEFELHDSSPFQALYSLKSDSSTMAVYPYRFEFQLAYLIEDRQLTVTYRIRNEDDKVLYFSVGGHPAFNVPFLAGESYEDYYLEFEKEENLVRHLLSENGLFNGETEQVPLDGRKLWLTKNMFDRDALVFKNLLSSKIALRSIRNPHFIHIDYSSFDYLGIWAKPGAPFACIEPWLGCADTEGKPVDIRQKEAIQQADPGAAFEKSFTITVDG